MLQAENFGFHYFKEPLEAIYGNGIFFNTTYNPSMPYFDVFLSDSTCYRCFWYSRLANDHLTIPFARCRRKKIGVCPPSAGGKRGPIELLLLIQLFPPVI